MKAELAVQIALFLPFAAAVLALMLGDDAAGGRVAPVLALVAGAVAAGVATGFAITGRTLEWQGFEVDAWRGILAAGALLGSAAVASNAGPARRAAVGVAAGLAAASLLSPDVLRLGTLLAASTLAVAVAALTERSGALRAMRALAPVVASDVAALIGLSIAATSSLRPEGLSAPAGWLLLAAGALRLGLVPGLLDEGLRAGMGGWLLGAARAQGALLVVMAVGGSQARGYALLAAGGIAAAAASVGMLRREQGDASVWTAHGALVAVAVGVGGSVATTGAGALLAVGFAAVGLSLVPSLARISMSFAPAGGALLGLSLAAGAVWRLAAARPEFVPVAVAVVVAAALAAVRARPEAPRGAAHDRSGRAALIVVPALVVAAAAGFAPHLAYEHAAVPVALAAGAPHALAGVPERVPESAGWVALALTLAALAAGGGRARGVGGQDRAAVPAGWTRGWLVAGEVPGAGSEIGRGRAAAAVRRWTIASAAAWAVALAFAVRLVLVAGGRGWL